MSFEGQFAQQFEKTNNEDRGRIKIPIKITFLFNPLWTHHLSKKHNFLILAFVSWTKFYTTFPKELKPIFNVKNAHMGHFAKSFGLKDQPSSFTKKHSAPKPALPTNRLTYTERYFSYISC